jgi:hypothetical protein
MIDKLQTFATWDRETQATCVCLYNMALGVPQAVQQPTPEEPLPAVRKSAIKEKRAKRRYFPQPHWSEDDRLELFAQFDQGNHDWVSLARRFGRSEGAIRAQFDKSYREFKGE